MPDTRISALVTGGAGFIGSHLCEFLLERGRQVICVDNYSTGQEAHIDSLLANPYFEFVRHDLTEPLDLTKLAGATRLRAAFAGVQEVYHLGCPSSPAYHLAHPIETIASVVMGTKHVLDIAARHRAGVVYLSDAAVYGMLPDPQFSPLEEYNGLLDHTDPLHYYAQAKRTAESMVLAYGREFSLHTHIVRLFSTYGPRMPQDAGYVIAEWIKAALAGTPLTLPPGLEKGSVCYVADVVNALEKIMTLEGGGIYNLGQSTVYTYKELAKKILQLTASSSSVQAGMPQDGDLLARAWVTQAMVPTIRKVRDDAAWFPVVLPDEGLRSTVDYIKSLRGIKRAV